MQLSNVCQETKKWAWPEVHYDYIDTIQIRTIYYYHYGAHQKAIFFSPYFVRPFNFWSRRRGIGRVGNENLG